MPASNEKTGSWNYSNDNGAHSYGMGWKLTLTEGNLDYVNNTSRVYYYFGIKNNTTATSWRASRSNWICWGFDSDATYDDEVNYRYNSSGTLYNTDWKDGYYYHRDKVYYMAAWCNSSSYQHLDGGTGDIDSFSRNGIHTTNGTAFRTVTHAADGTASVKFGLIWARRDSSNWNGLYGQFTKKTVESDTLTLTNTRATVKIYNGSSWVNAIPYVYNGSAWKLAIPYVYNGSTWAQCTG